MTRLLCCGLLLPVLLPAQIQLFTFDGTSEKPVAAVTDFGSIVSGDAREVRFRIRNTGAAPASVQTLSLPAQGFAFNPMPLLPILIAPSNFNEFRVRFAAVVPGSYSGMLSVGSLQTLVRATVAAGPTVSLADDVAGSLLASGATIDLGRIKRGKSAERELRIANGTSTSLTIQDCWVSGLPFRLSGIACPAVLSPGQAINATVVFEPAKAGDFGGSLTLDTRVLALHGVAYDPPLPKASIAFDSPLISGTQRKLAIPLSATSETAGTGTVTMEFRPSDASFPDDAAIRFTSSGGRVAALRVNEGDTMAQFATGADATFQTGTTAGVLTFKVKFSDYQQDFAFPIAPVPVTVDTISLSRRPGTIDIAITAFDNTRTSGRFGFTFYDTAGRVIQPGAIRADWSESFLNYFHNSKVGGSFAMRASFPVTGDPASIGSLEIECSNSAGVTRTPRIQATPQ